MNEPPITFGILGSGNMARVYGDALATQVPDGRLAAIALGTRAGSLAAEFGVAAEPSAEALLARGDVDVVVIATPHSTHLALALAAAAAGKHVYLEKPMALDVAECDADHRRLPGRGRPADDRQADAPHGDVDARQGVHRRGPDRRPPVPAAGERHAGRRASRTSRRAGRSIPARATPSSTGAPTPATRCAGSPAPTRSRVYADYDNFTGLPRRAGPDGARPDPHDQRRHRPDPALLRDRPVGLRDAAEQPVHDRRHEGLDLLGSRPLRALDGRPRPPDLGAAVAGRCPTSSRATRAASATRRARSSGSSPSSVPAGGRRVTGEDGREAIEMTQAAKLSAQTGRAVDLPLA